MREPLSRFKKGAVIVHILHHALKEPFYGTWLKSELENHGYDVSFGTLYPWLNSLKNQGILTQIEKNVEGKIRKYYSITEKGKIQLEEIKKMLRELHDEVIE